MGQPILVGHHSERRHRRTLDRSWNALGRAVEAGKLAERHESKAAGIEAQLDRSIFSDDGDAIDKIKERIAANEAKREEMKKINLLYRKADVAGLAALKIDYEALKTKLAAAGSYWGSAPYLPYSLTNLGARIRDDKKRLGEVAYRQKKQAAAEASENGVTITKSGDGAYCSVTFAEKPERAILNDLKQSNFHWSGGSWHGTTDKLPAAVAGRLGTLTTEAA